MHLAPLLVTAAESKAVGGINPYIVGGGVLLLLALLMLGLLAFGGGRDHT